MFFIWVNTLVAFTPANVPASVDSVEKLATWSLSILAELHPQQTIQTNRNTLEPVATVQTFDFRNNLVDSERLVLAAYIPLVPTWRGAGRIWEEAVGDISDASIPLAYTQ